VEVWWRSLFRGTALGKRCTSYNALPTSRKLAADCWSLLNFLPRSSLFMVGKAQKSHGAKSGLYGGFSNGVSSIHFFQIEHRIQFRSRPHAISGLFQSWKWSSEARNFEVFNGLQPITFSRSGWSVLRKRDRYRTFTKFWAGVTSWFHELFKRPSRARARARACVRAWWQ
jgi:hypothetical protein